MEEYDQPMTRNGKSVGIPELKGRLETILDDLSTGVVNMPEKPT